jgi:hypothetical protein
MCYCSVRRNERQLWFKYEDGKEKWERVAKTTWIVALPFRAFRHAKLTKPSQNQGIAAATFASSKDSSDKLPRPDSKQCNCQTDTCIFNLSSKCNCLVISEFPSLHYIRDQQCRLQHQSNTQD